MTEISDAKPRKPWWKRLIYLAIGIAIGLAYKNADPDLTRLHPPRPIVLELYTSLGCPQCPPADKLLGELADRLGDRVLPLAFHVTYLDLGGWRDPYDKGGFDNRQQGYHALLGQTFTPQLVIEGLASMQGAETRYIKQQILAASKALPNIPVQITRQKGQVCAAAPTAERAAELRLVGYLPAAPGTTRGGQQHGLRNVVKELRELPADHATPRCFPADPALRYAAILQDAGQGRMLGAAIQPLP